MEPKDQSRLAVGWNLEGLVKLTVIISGNPLLSDQPEKKTCPVSIYSSQDVVLLSYDDYFLNK